MPPKPDKPDKPGKPDRTDEVIDALGHVAEAMIGLTEAMQQGFKTQTEMEEAQMATLEELQTEVSQNTDVTQSAITLISGLSQQLKDALAANDPAAIQAVVDQLDANTNSLAEAVANVPHVEPR
jgi:N-acetylglucosamine kinase-like BadF-type ATPase